MSYIPITLDKPSLSRIFVKYSISSEHRGMCTSLKEIMHRYGKTHFHCTLHFHCIIFVKFFVEVPHISPCIPNQSLIMNASTWKLQCTHECAHLRRKSAIPIRLPLRLISQLRQKLSGKAWNMDHISKCVHLRRKSAIPTRSAKNQIFHYV